jgi:D-xylonolactonase
VTQAELLVEVRNTIGESPVWLAQSETLYWVDAEGSTVYWRAARDGFVGSRTLEVPVTALIPSAHGGWTLVTKDGLCSATADFTSVEGIVDPSAHDGATRLNDGVADRWGRVWTGSQSRGAPEDPIGRLYVVSPGGAVAQLDDGFAVTNGIAMSPDGDSVYVSDMFHRRIRIYRLDPDSGEVIDRPPAITTQGPGYPDGLAVDGEGFIWVAYWGGSRVERIDAAGNVVATVSVPAELATRCCLGGRSGSQLFVATARFGLDELQLQGQPLAGALFTTDVEAVGLPPLEARL